MNRTLLLIGDDEVVRTVWNRLGRRFKSMERAPETGVRQLDGMPRLSQTILPDGTDPPSEILRASGVSGSDQVLLDTTLTDAHELQFLANLLGGSPRLRLLILANPSQEEPLQCLEPTPASPISVEKLEWEYIQRVLKEQNGNVSSTARALGMHRRTLQRKLQKRTSPP